MYTIQLETNVKILSQNSILTHKNIKEIYSSYLKTFYRTKKEDLLNQGVYDKLLNKLKIRQRLKYSVAFWYTFYVCSGYFIALQYKFTKFFKFWFFLFLIVPNTYFYYYKFSNNSLEMHKLILIYHLKYISLPSITENYSEIYDQILSDYEKLYN